MKTKEKKYKIIICLLLLTFLTFPIKKAIAKTYSCEDDCGEAGKNKALFNFYCDDEGLNCSEECCYSLDLNLQYPVMGNLDINENQNINDIILWWYQFSIAISGFAAFFMFVMGGFEWTYSAGNPSVISEAQEKIKSAAIGLIIVLSAYLILQLINPELTMFSLPEIE